jgi:hypothetical protein
MNLARAARPVVATLSSTLALSCGPATPAALEAPATQVRPAVAPAAPPPPDLRAVPDPPALVLSGHIAKPSASLAIVRGWTRQPVPQSEEATELAIGEAVGPLVDLDQPVDFAVAVAGGAQLGDRTAVSLALKDPDRAKATLSERYKLVPGENGAFVLQALNRPGHHDDDGDEERADEDRRSCEIAPAYGAAPTRLVCGWSRKALTELGPWLTRTATRETKPSDVHVDLRLLPLRSTLSGQKRLIGGLLAGALASRVELSGARALVGSVGGDVVDFALDLEGASLDASLADPAAAATLTLRFSGKTSALARVATGHPERTGPAPAMFWQLPADADFAFFDRGVDEAEVARGRELALRLIGDALGEAGLKDADRKPILDALGKVASSAPMVYASGLDPDAVSKAIAAEKSHSDGSDPAGLAEAERMSIEALLGWRVVELDEPASRLAGALKDFAGAWGKPAVAATLRGKVKGGPPPSFRAASMPKTPGLPAGAQHYVLELYSVEAPAPGNNGGSPAAGKPKSPAAGGKPVTVHVFLAGDGDRTWLALGGEEPLVASKLALSIGSAGDKLAGRAELAALKSSAIGAGGFATMHGLPEVAALFGGSVSSATDGFEEVGRLPHHGTAPIAFSLTARPDGSEVAATVEVPRAAIEDIVTEILRHGF